MGNLNTLADNIKRLKSSLGKEASDHAVKTAITIVGDLAYKTPVDTSEALSNWVVSIGEGVGGIVRGAIPPHFRGKHGSTYKASAAETVSNAKIALQAKQPGETIWITNSAPHIKYLNDGSSAQQPAGFVERAILLGRKMKGNFKIRML